MSTAGAYQPSPAEAGAPDAAPLLSVSDLRVEFRRRGRRPVHAVDGISFEVEPGRTIGVVGESGCGKSVTSLAILGLLPKRGAQVAGSVRFAGRELLKLSDQELREIRGREIAMIFQDPMTSLNPVLTVGDQITEVLRRHFGRKGREATGRGGVAAGRGRHPRRPPAGRRLPAPALGRDAPAGHDRHGPGLPARSC